MDKDLKKAQDKIADLLDEEELQGKDVGDSSDTDMQDEETPEEKSTTSSDTDDHSQSYYLEVAKEGQQPEFPEADLVTGSQWLEKGYVQHWAYPKESDLAADDIPPAEKLAREYQADKPGILINQQESGLLELILTKDGHAWARAESDLKNLNDNVSEMLDFAQTKFKIKVEGYMTTDTTPSEVEKTLEDIDDSDAPESTSEKAAQPVVSHVEEIKEEKREELPTRRIPTAPVDSFDSFEKEPVTPSMHPEDRTISSMATGYNRSQAVEEDSPAIRSVFSPHQASPHMPHLYSSTNRSSSKKGWIVIAVALVALGGVGYAFRQQFRPLVAGLLNVAPSPSPSPVAVPTPLPSPTPEPTVERSSYKIRVLNGTTKTGAAGTLADSLKALGWKVEKTGNATDSATPKSYIRTKNGLSDLMYVLGKDSGLNPASSSALKASDTVDAELVIGKE